MTKQEEGKPVNPSRKDRLRPVEILGFSGVLALFAGLVVLGSTREPWLSLAVFALGFIVCVMTVALVGLGMKPNEQDREARKDLKKPDWH